MPKMSYNDAQDLASDVSGLSSLENDAEDDFEKLMIQNARDERRLNEALHGRVEAFRKARTYPRVGLTMENLERSHERSNVKFQSPPSSSGSTRSDPAIHAPPGWGRKSRQNRNWMRTITHDSETQQTPVPADDLYQPEDPNLPRNSIEDSPLSRKSSRHGTPRNDRSVEWDLTFELNEASMIASTPYIPRNTALDDIRRREIEGLSEQHDTTFQNNRARRSSPESTRTANSRKEQPGGISPQKPLQKRCSSWQTVGKSQPVTGIGKETSPVAVYKSAEFADTVKHNAQPDLQKDLPKSASHRKGDSQDLLRRLARASNTPSPGRTIARPQTAPAGQPNNTAQTMPSSALSRSLGDQPEKLNEIPIPTEHVSEPEDIDATPMPTAPSSLHMKTPVVTGAWIDTPGPRTARRRNNLSEVSLQSPERTEKGSPAKGKSPQKIDARSTEEALSGVAAETIRPSLPGSALQALVQEAKANGRRQSADFGDSTINSLEDLITPMPENIANGMDEDTLQGLQLPTGTPRNEAERQRQEEVLHLHRMNDRLRAARTSIRDASRGMKRVEDRVEHVDEREVQGNGGRATYQNCPCVVSGGHEFSLRQWAKSLLWQEGIKMKRKQSNSLWKIWGGLTGLGILMLVGFVWWVSEGIAWYEFSLSQTMQSHTPLCGKGCSFQR